MARFAPAPSPRERAGQADLATSPGEAPNRGRSALSRRLGSRLKDIVPDVPLALLAADDVDGDARPVTGRYDGVDAHPSRRPGRPYARYAAPPRGVYDDHLPDARLGPRADLEPGLPREVHVRSDGREDLARLKGAPVVGRQHESVVPTFQGADISLHPLGASAQRLLLATVHQVRTGDTVRKPEVVVDHGPARHALVGVQDGCLQSGVVGEDLRARTSRPTAHDHKVIQRPAPFVRPWFANRAPPRAAIERLSLPPDLPGSVPARRDARQYTWSGGEPAMEQFTPATAWSLRVNAWLTGCYVFGSVILRWTDCVYSAVALAERRVVGRPSCDARGPGSKSVLTTHQPARSITSSHHQRIVIFPKLRVIRYPRWPVCPFEKSSHAREESVPGGLTLLDSIQNISYVLIQIGKLFFGQVRQCSIED